MDKSIKYLLFFSLIVIVLITASNGKYVGHTVSFSKSSNGGLEFNFYDINGNPINLDDSFSIINYAGTNNVDVPDVYYIDFTAKVEITGTTDLKCQVNSTYPALLYNYFNHSYQYVLLNQLGKTAWTSDKINTTLLENFSQVRYNITVRCISNYGNITNSSYTDMYIKVQRVPNYCYQESPNVVNQNLTDGSCGQIYTGTITRVYFGTNPTRVYDGDWTNYGVSSTSIPYKSRLYINYTKPPTAYDTSIWKVKDGSGTKSLSIPSVCWDEGARLNLYIMSESMGHGDLRYCGGSTNCKAIEWGCLDGSTEIPLRIQYSTGLSSTSYAYEEAMKWDVP